MSPPSWITGWPLLPLSALLLWGLWLLRELRPTWRTALVFVVALAASAVLMPLSQHVFDGHESEYLDIALGRQGLDAGDTYRLPTLQWLYRGLGAALPAGAVPYGLIALSLSAGALGVSAASAALQRLVSPRVGLSAGLVLALWGTIAAWSSSAYNVILPWSMGMVAIWGLALIIDGRSQAGGLVAGAAAGLAVCFRVEAILLALPGLLLLLAHRPGAWRAYLPGLLAGALIAGVSTWSLLGGKMAPGSGERAMSLYNNMDLFIYFEPFQRPWVLPSVLLGLGLGLWRWPRVYLPLAVGVVLLHCVMASFNDYGSRHVLAAGMGLAASLGALTLYRWAWPLLVVAGAGIVVDLADTSGRYYADEEQLALALDPELPVWTLADLAECPLLCEDSRVVPEGQQRSHFNLLDPHHAQGLIMQHGCMYWLYGEQDYRWSSRAVRDRALRLERLYELEAVAVVKEPEGGYVALVVSVGQRRRWPKVLPVHTLP